MNLSRSINKRISKHLAIIKGRYLSGLRNGKNANYYYSPSFYKYYFKRLFWLLAKCVTLDPQPYKTFSKIISSKYYPYHSTDGVYHNNTFKEFVRALMGYSFLSAKKLYPAYTAKFRSEEHTSELQSRENL